MEIQKTNKRPRLTTDYEDRFSQWKIGREIIVLESTQTPKIALVSGKSGREVIPQEAPHTPKIDLANGKFRREIIALDSPQTMKIAFVCGILDDK